MSFLDFSENNSILANREKMGEVWFQNMSNSWNFSKKMRQFRKDFQTLWRVY